MVIKVYKSKKLRKLFLKKEFLKTIYKFLKIHFLKNLQFYNKYLCVHITKYQKKIIKISKTKLYNRCIMTNRGRGIVSNYNISRIKLRELIQVGYIPGYDKAVW